MCVCIHIPFHNEHLNTRVLKLPKSRFKFIKIHDFKLILTWNQLGREYLKITCTTSLEPVWGNTIQTFRMYTWLAHFGSLELLYLRVNNWLRERVEGWTRARAITTAVAGCWCFSTDLHSVQTLILPGVLQGTNSKCFSISCRYLEGVVKKKDFKAPFYFIFTTHYLNDMLFPF